MARTYAGILAHVGLLVVLCRSLKNGAGFDGTILQGLVTMALLAAVGLVVGIIAETTIDDSVRASVQADLDALTNPQKSQPTN